MKENQITNHKIQKAIDEASLINESENKPNDTQKEKKTQDKEQEQEKEKENNKCPIPNLLELSSKKIDPENEKDKILKESSDYEIDILTESSGFNKKQNNNENEINNIELINIDNDNDENNSNEYIIDISEEKNSTQSKDSSKNDQEYSLSESIRRPVPKNRFLRGHCPFNFFEKEKCKNIDFKKVNVRTYISNLSAQWKKMSDKEKEPYIKLSEEFKKNYLANISSEDSEDRKII